jgi:hypothetical protein
MQQIRVGSIGDRDGGDVTDGMTGMLGRVREKQQTSAKVWRTRLLRDEYRTRDYFLVIGLQIERVKVE